MKHAENQTSQRKNNKEYIEKKLIKILDTADTSIDF